MKNPFTVCLLLICFMVQSCHNETKYETWMVALKTSKDGNVIKGSKPQLIKAIRNGADIKIGWGNKGKNHSIEHLSVPIWLAVLDGKEVLAKLHPQYSSTLDWDTLSGNHSDKEVIHQEWRVVINTDGSFDAIWYDRKTDSLIRRVPQHHTMTWFVRNQTKGEERLYK
ncbi:hypothetical protein [uncultured Croceitalea sp.]|uniref:hypothetical protein n=1 Tax=uncultured Croceitalea sp. TaxID=1798908 RepID=UPI003305FA11